jgi:hypothetical protein
MASLARKVSLGIKITYNKENELWYTILKDDIIHSPLSFFAYILLTIILLLDPLLSYNCCVTLAFES